MMTREEFFIEACLRAMQGLLSASGDYRDELIVDPPKHLAVAAHQYAQALTQQIYGDPIEWPSEINNMEQTAVEWLVEQMNNIKGSSISMNGRVQFIEKELNNLFDQAKAMEKEQAHKYAEFAIRCDRKDMKILNFEDWIKL